MKKIILFLLLLCTASFAQITVVGDTTDLKNIKESGVVLLEQFGKGNTSGGGFFHRIDSTYTEGRDAFDYYVAGYQWARIGYVEYAEMYINSLDTTSLTTDSVYYTINGWTDGNVDGITTTDSTITLNSDAYYAFTASFSYTATDSVKYQIGLYKNNTADAQSKLDFEVADNSTAIQNLTISGIVYSDGNDIFKLKVAIRQNNTAKEFIIRQANLKFIKIN